MNTFIGNDIRNNIKDIIEGRMSIEEIGKLYASKRDLEELDPSEYDRKTYLITMEKLINSGKICYIEEENLPELPHIDRKTDYYGDPEAAYDIYALYPEYRKYYYQRRENFLQHWCLDEIDFCVTFLSEFSESTYEEKYYGPLKEEIRPQIQEKEGKVQDILKLYFPEYASVIENMTPEMIIDFREYDGVLWDSPSQREQVLEKYPDFQDIIENHEYPESLQYVFRRIYDREKRTEVKETLEGAREGMISDAEEQIIGLAKGAEEKENPTQGIVK